MRAGASVKRREQPRWSTSFVCPYYMSSKAFRLEAVSYMWREEAEQEDGYTSSTTVLSLRRPRAATSSMTCSSPTTTTQTAAAVETHSPGCKLKFIKGFQPFRRPRNLQRPSMERKRQVGETEFREGKRGGFERRPRAKTLLQKTLHPFSLPTAASPRLKTLLVSSSTS